jgi:hypothetical protein
MLTRTSSRSLSLCSDDHRSNDQHNQVRTELATGSEAYAVSNGTVVPVRTEPHSSQKTSLSLRRLTLYPQNFRGKRKEAAHA